MIKKLLSLGDDLIQGHKSSDKWIPQAAWRCQSREHSLSKWIRVQTTDRKAFAILDWFQTTIETQAQTNVTTRSDHPHHHWRHK